MSNFQIVILDNSTGKQVNKGKKGEKFAIEQHSRTSDKIARRIENLEEVWDGVIKKLTTLASKTQEASAISQFELDSIEFNIGFEAGLSVGFVTKADASVSIIFSKKSDTNK